MTPDGVGPRQATAAHPGQKPLAGGEATANRNGFCRLSRLAEKRLGDVAGDLDRQPPPGRSERSRTPEKARTQ